MALVNAKCTNCGGEIQLDNSKKTGFCLHCGSKVNVSEAVKEIKINKSDDVEKYLKLAKNANEGKNYEELEKYCNMILEIDNSNIEIWYLKGKAVGWQSTIANNRFSEMVTAFKSGLECLGNNDKEKLVKYSDEMCAEIFAISNAVVDLVCGNFSKNVSENNASNYINQISKMIEVLYPLEIILASNLGSEFDDDVDVMNNYAAVKGYKAALDGWESAKAEFGTTREEQSKYAWQRFVADGDLCLSVLNAAFILSKEKDTSSLIVNDYININNIIINSCSYKLEFNQYGSYYTSDYSLTRAAKNARKNMNQEMLQKLEEKKIKLEEEKREYYRTHPDILKKEIKEKNKIIEASMQKFNDNKEKIEEIENKIMEYEDEKAELGLFKLQERSELKQKIRLEQQRINQLENENIELNNEISKAEEFLEKYDETHKHSKSKEDDNETEYNCGNCGAAVAESDTKCPKCGFLFEEEE